MTVSTFVQPYDIKNLILLSKVGYNIKYHLRNNEKVRMSNSRDREATYI